MSKTKMKKALTAREMLKRLYDGARLVPAGGPGYRPYFESGIAKVSRRQVTILQRAGLIQLLYPDKEVYAVGQRYIISQAGREKVQLRLDKLSRERGSEV